MLFLKVRSRAISLHTATVSYLAIQRFLKLASEERIAMSGREHFYLVRRQLNFALGGPLTVEFASQRARGMTVA